MKKGKLIVIEGIDGSGKATQAALLVSKLKSHGYKVATLNIPQYQTFFGKMIARYLQNEFGRTSPYLASMLYAANRYEVKDKLNKWLKEGFVVVLNRYATSNLIHQTADLENKRDRLEFEKWISEMEYKVFGLPKPDYVLLLDMPANLSNKLIEQKSFAERKHMRGAKRDILESDFEFQKKSLLQAHDLLKKNKNWIRIQCVENGLVRSKKDIASAIWQSIVKLLK